MPPNKCPYTKEQLEALYADMHAEQIAAHVGKTLGISVTKCGVINWLKRFDIPRRKFSPYSENRIDCPFSAARLNDMYWLEEMSLTEICDAASEILGRPIHQKTLQRWMDEFGIKPRSYNQAQQVRVKKHPEQGLESIKYARAVLDKNPDLRRKGGLSKRAQRKGRKLAARIKRERALETRNCAYCGNPVTRRHCDFQHPPERTFCNRSCANKWRHYLRRLEKIQPGATERIYD